MVCRTGFEPVNRNGAVLQTVCFNLLHTDHIWCSRLDSNQRHAVLQTAALPTELQKQMVTRVGFEPTIISAVKGRQLYQFVQRAI